MEVGIVQDVIKHKERVVFWIKGAHYFNVGDKIKIRTYDKAIFEDTIIAIERLNHWHTKELMLVAVENTTRQVAEMAERIEKVEQA